MENLAVSAVSDVFDSGVLLDDEDVAMVEEVLEADVDEVVEFGVDV